MKIKPRYSYKFIWIIVPRWRNFHHYLQVEFTDSLKTFPIDYQKRLTRSSIRGASLMLIMAQANKKKFNKKTTLITGMLAALFDDLIEIENHSAEVISQLITFPHKTCIDTNRGRFAKQCYLELLHLLESWQITQLQQFLLKLNQAEHISISENKGNWEQRGSLAFLIFSTVIGIQKKDINFNVVAGFGNYLQILDDYEDIGTDTPELNYFISNPDFKMDEYYLEQIKPTIHQLYFNGFNHRYFSEFIDTYHIFQVRSHRHKHIKETAFLRFQRKSTSYIIKQLNNSVQF